jgi:hypothetical protein
MKAAILHSADAVPVYGDFDDPAAGAGTEIVDLVAAGIHQVTRSVATGRHYGGGELFPVIPGLNAIRHVRRAHRLARRDAVPAARRDATGGRRGGHQSRHGVLAAAQGPASRARPP